MSVSVPRAETVTPTEPVDGTPLIPPLQEGDRLTRDEFRIYNATNFLKTVQPYIENSRAEIKLPQSMLDVMLAETYLWIAEVRLDMSDPGNARENLVASLKYRFIQPRAWLLYFFCFLPRGVGLPLRRFYRMIKSWHHREASCP